MPVAPVPASRHGRARRQQHVESPAGRARRGRERARRSATPRRSPTPGLVAASIGDVAHRSSRSSTRSVAGLDHRPAARPPAAAPHDARTTSRRVSDGAARRACAATARPSALGVGQLGGAPGQAVDDGGEPARAEPDGRGRARATTGSQLLDAGGRVLAPPGSAPRPRAGPDWAAEPAAGELGGDLGAARRRRRGAPRARCRRHRRGRGRAAPRPHRAAS